MFTEIGIVSWMNGLHTGLIGAVTSFFYYAFEPPLAVLYVVLIGIVLACRRADYRVLFTFGATVAFTWLPIVILKMLFYRPRPDAALLPHAPVISPTDWSFPSGHMTFIMALAIAVFFFTNSLRSGKQTTADRIARIVAVTLVPVLAISVLIVGVHYPTDILFSLGWAGMFTPPMFHLATNLGQRLPQTLGRRTQLVSHAPNRLN